MLSPTKTQRGFVSTEFSKRVGILLFRLRLDLRTFQRNERQKQHLEQGQHQTLRERTWWKEYINVKWT